MAFGDSATMAVLVLSALLHSAAATTYIVGANVGGWTLQTRNTNVYDPEFANIKLVPGDELLFPFTSGEHNVYEISPADLASCNTGNAISMHTNTNATIKLATAGVHAFICAIPTHCSNSGMHLEVNVSAAAAAPAPTPAITPLTPAPSTKAPAPSTKAPAPAPKAASPKAPSPPPKSSVTPGVRNAPAPAPGGSGSNAANTLLSAPLMMVGSLLAGCALLLL